MSGKSGFLATAVLGGAVYWLWQKARRANGALPVPEITRWEDEGGAVHGGSSELKGAASARPVLAGASAAEPAHSGGSTPDAWLFPRN